MIFIPKQVRKCFCKTCRNYPRHIEEFEGLREISLVAFLPGSSKDPAVTERKSSICYQSKRIAVKKPTMILITLLFTALMDTRDAADRSHPEQNMSPYRNACGKCWPSHMISSCV